MKEYFIVGLVSVVIYSLACGYFAGSIAEQKKYDFLKWFFLGFFFNIAAIITIGAYQINPDPEPSYSDD